MKVTSVLIIDDDKALTSIVAGMCEVRGRKTHICHGAEEAVEAVSNGRVCPDVILVDVHLPGIKGYELISKLRGITDAPMIAMSVDADRESIGECIRRGAFGYLIKPFTLDMLDAQIDAAIRRCREMQRLKETIEMAKPINQAIGILVARRSISPEEAEGILRSMARKTGRKMADVAREIVEQTTAWVGSVQKGEV